MAATEPVLSVRNLRVEIPTRRGLLVAVDDISFDLAAGEVLGLVGESGAGKSLAGAALVRLLASPIRIAGGTVTLNGERIDHLPAEAMRRIRGRQIGFIFQDPLTALDPLYSIGAQLVETICTHLSLNAAAAKQRAIDLLGQVGIPAPDKRFDSLPHELSGGMRQRVVIALALCADPALVIADEPTTALDVSIQAQIIDLLKKICRERGTAILLITHDMGVIAEIADRVAVMYAGRIVETGGTRRIIRAPTHPYTRGLMGAIPKMAARQARLTQIEGSMPRLNAIPAGCAFHPRCPDADTLCQKERPVLAALPDGAAACWHVAAETTEPEKRLVAGG